MTESKDKNRAHDDAPEGAWRLPWMPLYFPEITVAGDDVPPPGTSRTKRLDGHEEATADGQAMPSQESQLPASFRPFYADHAAGFASGESPLGPIALDSIDASGAPSFPPPVGIARRARSRKSEPATKRAPVEVQQVSASTAAEEPLREEKPAFTHVRKYNEAPEGDYRLGIDIGSKTIKLILLGENGRVLYERYARHRSVVREKLIEALHTFAWQFGDCEATVAVTGSAGIAIAETLHLPFVQEVVATTEAVKTDYPEADCVIELGGEDAKIIYLTGGLEQRMNASCAGGTGGFIETIAHILGVHTRQMSTLALGSSRTYPIASRCAVFAQTDVRPLLNAGASKSDIAASALEAVVQQTLGGLACGRPVEGTTVFLGGPIEHQPALVLAFRRALKLSSTDGIKPHHAHLLTGKGAAIMGARMQPVKKIRISELIKAVEESPDPENDLEHLPPLFETQEQRDEFVQRHKAEVMPRRLLSKGKPPFYLGLDAGSTSVKYALVDSDGMLVRSDYEKFEGDVLETAVSLLRVLLSDFDKSRPLDDTDWYIARATVTGYGEELLKAALGFDDGVVETTAHVRGARAFRPDVSFVLDIGGQDMKALWVHDGRVVDAVLNEACSSGCGAFIEGTARGMEMTPEMLSHAALQASNPVDLGTKCTVFMNSRVKHAQKVGAAQADVAAGAAYSVVKNALYRIIGRNKAAALGDAIVVQGGTFRSDAILRAFELVGGVQAIRPDTAHVMGAMGAALVGRDQVEAGLAPRHPSSLISVEDMRNLQVMRKPMRCPGCANNCRLSVTTFEIVKTAKGVHPWEKRRQLVGQGNAGQAGGFVSGSEEEQSAPTRAYITGNKCERVWDFVGEGKLVNAGTPKQKGPLPPNAVKVEQKLIASFGTKEGEGARGACTIGLLNGLNSYQLMPFWHTFLSSLGFSLRVAPDALTNSQRSKASETIPSESVCQPAKLLHLRSYELLQAGVDALFLPSYERGTRCPVASWYPKTLGDNLNAKIPFASPVLHSIDPEKLAQSEADKSSLLEALQMLAEPYGAIGQAEFAKALEAGLQAQRSFYDKVERATERALAWVEANPNRRGVVLIGRPYHIDQELLHGIDDVLAHLGVAVLPTVGLRARIAAAAGDGSTVQSAYWKPAKHILRTAALIGQNPQLEAVALVSFNCGFDAVSFDEARKAFAQMEKPFTELKIDDIVDTAHIRIRLRTLVEGMQYARLVKTGSLESEPGSKTQALQQAACGSRPIRSVSAEEAEALGVAAECAAELDFDISEEDVATARARVTSDLCFTAAALAAHAGNLLNADPSIHVLRVPHVCDRCLVDSLPFQVSRICNRDAGIMWEHELPAGCSVPNNSALDLGKPLIGIVGNPLLCFSDYMNERVAQLIESLGCQVYWPHPENLFVDDVRYLAQMDEFAQAGVRHVIYLQSFGCLKGHVRSRGALRELARLYPGITITVLDYDPETSALNRENRIRLALYAATHAQLAADEPTSERTGSGVDAAAEPEFVPESEPAKPRKMPPYDIQAFKDDLYKNGRYTDRFGCR